MSDRAAIPRGDDVWSPATMNRTGLHAAGLLLLSIIAMACGTSTSGGSGGAGGSGGSAGGGGECSAGQTMKSTVETPDSPNTPCTSTCVVDSDGKGTYGECEPD